jgi:NADPH:quinone reductase-like Zn-dependent oxidoreductase
MAAFNPIFDMAKRHVLLTRVEKSYPLSEAKAALEQAARTKRSGKIIFDLSAH